MKFKIMWILLTSKDHSTEEDHLLDEGELYPKNQFISEVPDNTIHKDKGCSYQPSEYRVPENENENEKDIKRRRRGAVTIPKAPIKMIDLFVAITRR